MVTFNPHKRPTLDQVKREIKDLKKNYILLDDEFKKEHNLGDLDQIFVSNPQQTTSTSTTSTTIHPHPPSFYPKLLQSPKPLHFAESRIPPQQFDKANYIVYLKTLEDTTKNLAAQQTPAESKYMSALHKVIGLKLELEQSANHPMKF